MKLATYNEELRQLVESYALAGHADVEDFVELQASMGDRPALFVASGGGLAIAQVAAEAQTRAYGALAVATTPLAMVGGATVRDASVVVISSRAAHADIAFCLSQAQERHSYPVALVTHRDPSELKSSVTRHLSTVIHVPALVRDGFLATNSILCLATMFLRAASPDLLLPNLPWLNNPMRPLSADRIIVLFGPGQQAAAIDLETRLAELGLASVQVVDYRNFAHGRHTGFARNLGRTQLIALADKDTEKLAEAVLNLLPTEASVYKVFSELQGPASKLDLMCASMRLVGATAAAVAINPARPKVPAFGRKLYHQSARSHLHLSNSSIIERKIAAGRLSASAYLMQTYAESYRRWCEDIGSKNFGAIVLDYDGTLCDTDRRYLLPSPTVQEAVKQLLSQGCRIGIATGRGVSLQGELRTWVPSEYWSLVTLGLYNGSLVRMLDESVAKCETSVYSEVQALAGRLMEEPLSHYVTIREGMGQLSLRPAKGATIGIAAIVSWANEYLQRVDKARFRVVRSGHSVDILLSSATKLSVVTHIEEKSNVAAMLIGDRGEVGGNDHELLASRPWSLSVDRCSGDPTRCWNIAPARVRGPEALVAYLRRFRPGSLGWRFTPPKL